MSKKVGVFEDVSRPVPIPPSTEKELQLLKVSHDSQKKLIVLLVAHYDAVANALARQKRGHGNGWILVQHIVDAIEDDYDLSVFRKER